MADSKKEFTVVMRGPSAAVFWPEEGLQVQLALPPFGPITTIFKNRWIKKGEELSVPGNMWLEIRGQGESLDSSLESFANAAVGVLPLIALATNAAVGELSIELGFDSTDGIKEREYFQSYVALESDAVHPARRINTEAVLALMAAVEKHVDRDRLMRATNQYMLALDSWKIGSASISTAHLWMGVEALTKVVIRSQLASRLISKDAELAEQLGIELKQLDSFVRKSFIMQSDEECYKKGKEVSDGLEHGFLGYIEMRAHSIDVRHRLAKYLRETILSLVDLENHVCKLMMSDPYDKPLGHMPLVKYFRGVLIGESENLAQEGSSYPFIRWSPSLQSTKPSESGEVLYTFTDSFTPELGKGISFKPTRIEVFKPD